MSFLSALGALVKNSAINIATIASYGAASIGEFKNIGLNALSNGALFYGIGSSDKAIGEMGAVGMGGFAAALTAADDYLVQNTITKTSYLTTTAIGSLIGYKLTNDFIDIVPGLMEDGFVLGHDDKLIYKVMAGAAGAIAGLATSYFTDYSVLDMIRGPGKILGGQYSDMQAIVGNSEKIAGDLREMATLLTASALTITAAECAVKPLVPADFAPLLPYLGIARSLLVMGASQAISSCYVGEMTSDIERALLERIFNKDDGLKLAEMREFDPAIQKLHIHISSMSHGLAQSFCDILPDAVVGLNAMVSGGGGKVLYTTFLNDALMSQSFADNGANLREQKALYSKAEADINNHMLDATHHLRAVIEMDGLSLFKNRISTKSEDWQVRASNLNDSAMNYEIFKMSSGLSSLLITMGAYAPKVFDIISQSNGGHLNQEQANRVQADFMKIIGDITILDQLSKFSNTGRVNEFPYSESIRVLKDLVSKLNEIKASHDVIYKTDNSFSGLAIKDLTVKLHDNVLSTIKDLYITKDGQKGQIIAVTGDSGCGKSTAFSVIKGLSVIGSDIAASGAICYGSDHEIPTIKMMTQADYFIRSATLAEIMNYPDPMNNLNIVKITRILDSLEDPDLARTEGGLLSTRLDEYHESWNDKISGGQKKKIKLAKALSDDDADFLLLDEIFTGLDEKSQKRAMEAIKKFAPNKNIIIVDHEAKSHQKMMNGKFYDAALNFTKGGETGVYDLNTGADISNKYHIPAELSASMDQQDVIDLHWDLVA